MPVSPKIVYSPNYDIRFFGIERLHPFDSRKYSRAWRQLVSLYGWKLRKCRIDPGPSVNRSDLELVHQESYLDQLKSSAYVAGVLGLPMLASMPIRLVDSHVLKPMRLAAAGTVKACEAALEFGMAVNLSGGYHHARPDSGEGFCAYGDAALAVAKLRASGRLVEGRDRVLYIDLDAHQGNGVEHFFMHDKDVYIFDMYNEDIYPGDRRAKARIDCGVPIASQTTDAGYLAALESHLSRALLECPQPTIAIYNAGTDVYEGDTLGRLSLTKNGILERDKMVLNRLTQAGIPWAMVLSGGYSKESYSLVAATVGYILETWGGFTP